MKDSPKPKNAYKENYTPEIIQDNRDRQFVSTVFTQRLDYDSEYCRDKLLVSPAQWITFAKELVMIIKFDAKILRIEQAVEMLNVIPRTWYSRLKLQPELQDYHNQAMHLIGMRREMLIGTGEISSVLLRYQYQFHDTYKEADLFKLMIEKGEDNVKDITIYMTEDKIDPEGLVAAKLKEIHDRNRPTPEQVAARIHKDTSNTNPIGRNRE